MVGDKIYETRLLPPGYSVRGYEVTWEQWSELPPGESEGLEARTGGVEAVTSGSVMGYSVMNLVVDPVRAEAGGVSVLRGLRMRVDCEPSSEGLRVHRRSRLTDWHLDQVVGRALGVDLGDYGDWTLEGYRDWPTEAPGLDGGVVDCVIVTSDELAGSFERLADWHGRLGIRTVVRGLGWIYSNYPGSDDPERIRNFLRDAYENWGTVYVVIGGDASVVPIRYAWTNHYGGESIPTDMYYSSLEGTWNENGNDIFGEYGDTEDTDDGVTFYAQLMPGRLLVRTVAETEDYIDKLIAYSTTPEPGWARKTLLLGEVIFPVDWQPGDDITLNGKDICDTAATYFPAYIDTAARYQELGSMDRDICLSEFSKGHNLVILAGHGDAFRTSTGDGQPPFIFNTDFDTLSNYNKYSFFYALNCNNSAVDVDCVFRHFVINPIGGGIGTYATTRYDFPNIGQYFLNEFCDYIYNRDITRLGDVCALHHHIFINSAQSRDGSVRWSMLTYLLAGDPTMHMWVDEPDTLDVSDTGTMTYDDSTYSVWVYDGGVPMKDATVVLSGDRGEYGIGRTDVGGMAVLEYRPKGPGYADLVVNKEGYLVYQDSVNVTGAGGRLYVSSVSIDDGGGYIGNGDGEAGWGERVGLGVGLVNGGAGTMSGVVGNLATIEGCSLSVDIQMAGGFPDSVIYIGRDRENPTTTPFGLNVGDEVLGRSSRSFGNEVGCWLWLDGMGWHVRFNSLHDSLFAYRCSLEVHGEIRGFTPVSVENSDDLTVGSDYILLDGEISLNDFEDGFDFLSGAGSGVVLHETSKGYGSVGATEVVRHYDVEFTGVAGDRIGAWFETMIEDGSANQWYDWFRVLVRDGSLKGERLDLVSLVGDSLGVAYGIRNIGSGGLKDIDGTLRAVSGAIVEDSLSAYGDLASREYGEGDGFVVKTTGGTVVFEVELVDTYGRKWIETVEIRDPLAASGLSYACGDDYIELSWDPGDTLFAGYDVYRADDLGGPYALVGMVEGYAHIVDEGLMSEEDYFYYVCVRDSMGNVSAPSETLEAWTGAPYQAGWPVGPPNVIYSSVCIDDLDGDGSLEIVVGSKDQNVHVWEHD
ncbi:MAG: C25 family cysteine peptidase, partial [bacterium]